MHSLRGPRFPYKLQCVSPTHLTCAVRELNEETGLVVNPKDVKHFATLRFTTDGQPGECRFFCCVDDVDAATTKEAERVFVDSVFGVMHGAVCYTTDERPRYHFLDTMPNLPWLCAMARQRLRSGYDGADVHVVEEVGRAVQESASDRNHYAIRRAGHRKSTSAAQLFAELKQRHVSTELAREYVKKWAWEGRKISGFDEYYFVGHQIREESLLFGKVDYIVTDKPLADGYLLQ